MHLLSVTVWCGFWIRGNIGFYIFENEDGATITDNGDTYCIIIIDFVEELSSILSALNDLKTHVFFWIINPLKKKHLKCILWLGLKEYLTSCLPLPKNKKKKFWTLVYGPKNLMQKTKLFFVCSLRNEQQNRIKHTEHTDKIRVYG